MAGTRCMLSIRTGWLLYSLTLHLCFLVPPHLGLLSFLSYLEPHSHFSNIVEHLCVNSESISLCCTNQADTPTPSVVPAVDPSHTLSTTVGGSVWIPHSSEPSDWAYQKSRKLFFLLNWLQFMPIVLVTIIAYWLWNLNLKTSICFY